MYHQNNDECINQIAHRDHNIVILRESHYPRFYLGRSYFVLSFN